MCLRTDPVCSILASRPCCQIICYFTSSWLLTTVFVICACWICLLQLLLSFVCNVLSAHRAVISYPFILSLFPNGILLPSTSSSYRTLRSIPFYQIRLQLLPLYRRFESVIHACSKTTFTSFRSLLRRAASRQLHVIVPKPAFVRPGRWCSLANRKLYVVPSSPHYHSRALFQRTFFKGYFVCVCLLVRLYILPQL